MALIFEVEYPGGERCHATGYPSSTLIVDIVPSGPQACYRDEIECELDGSARPRVRRVIKGPRRPTVRVRLEAGEAEIERWMDARDAEGWETRDSDDDPAEILVVAGRDGMAIRALEVDGATLVSRPSPGARVRWLLEHAAAFERVETAGDPPSDTWMRAVAAVELASLLSEPGDVLPRARELALLEPRDPEALLAVAAALGDADCARRALEIDPAYFGAALVHLPAVEAREAIEVALAELESAADASDLGRELSRLPAELRHHAWTRGALLPPLSRAALLAELAPAKGREALEQAFDAVLPLAEDGELGYRPVHALAPYITDERADRFVEMWTPFGVVGTDARPALARRLAELGRVAQAREVANQIDPSGHRLEARLGIAVFDPGSRAAAIAAALAARPIVRGLADFAAIASAELVERVVAEHPFIELVIDALEPPAEVRRRWVREALGRADSEIQRFAVARFAGDLEPESARDLCDDLLSQLARPYPGFSPGFVLVYPYAERSDLRALGPLLIRVGGEPLVRDAIDAIYADSSSISSLR